MSENELMTTSDRVLARIQKNEMGAISAELDGETAVELITGLAGIVGQVSGEAFQAVTKIYAQAIISAENVEIHNIDKEAYILRRFNDQVDLAMSQLDLKDAKVVANFNIALKGLREGLAQELNPRRSSFFNKIFKR